MEMLRLMSWSDLVSAALFRYMVDGVVYLEQWIGMRHVYCFSRK